MFIACLNLEEREQDGFIILKNFTNLFEISWDSWKLLGKLLGANTSVEPIIGTAKIKCNPLSRSEYIYI